MNVADAYVDAVGAALEAKISQLDKESLPQLKEQFKIILSAFQGILTILLKKGIIHDDPYRFDMKFSEVTCPPESSFTEAEKIDQMSIRISQYANQIDFLVNYYQFSYDFLSMERVKRLIAITRYFNFSQLSPNSNHINTRFFTEMLDQIRKGSDSISAGVVNDAVNHLERSSKAIMLILKDITLCHKESLKREIRAQVMPALRLERDFAVTHQDDAVKQIKRKYAESLPNRSFFPELAVEILQEDFSKDSDLLRQAVLKGLLVKVEAKKAVRQERDFKSTLMEGIRIMASIGLQLEDCVSKLEGNSLLLENERNTFWEKFKKTVRSMLNQSDKSVYYEIDYTDPVTTAQRSERLDFSSFCEEVQKKGKLFNSLNARAGVAYQRLEGSPEEQAYSFLDKSIDELQTIMRRLGALDVFFRSEVRKENRARLHGLKLEMDAVKNTLIKANQKKHEYVSQREELEQMKRLGIRTENV
jgi:hypothetical protein